MRKTIVNFLPAYGVSAAAERLLEKEPRIIAASRTAADSPPGRDNDYVKSRCRSAEFLADVDHGLARPRHPPGGPGRAKFLTAAQPVAATDVANSEPHS